MIVDDDDDEYDDDDDDDDNEDDDDNDHADDYNEDDDDDVYVDNDYDDDEYEDEVDTWDNVNNMVREAKTLVELFSCSYHLFLHFVRCLEITIYDRELFHLESMIGWINNR